MKIGYNKIIGILLIALGFFNCCVSVIFVRTGDSSVPSYIVAGFWFGMISGVLFLRQTYYIEVWRNELVVRMLFGLVDKRYKFNSAKDFLIEEGRIFLLTNGVREKLRIHPWLADRRTWKSFVELLQASQSVPASTSQAG